MLTKLKKLIIHRKVFITALLYGLIFGVVNNLWVYSLFKIFQGRLPETEFQLFIDGIDILRGLKDVLLSSTLFVTFYSLGKDIDLKNDYTNVSASLIIGCAPGLFLGWLLSTLIMSMEFWWYHFGDQLYRGAQAGAYCVTRQFFLGFTALALAYFRKREGSVEEVT